MHRFLFALAASVSLWGQDIVEESHLEPVPAYSIFLGDGDSYKKDLINNDNPILFMLCEPSFRGIYSIVLCSQNGNSNKTTHCLEYSIWPPSKKSKLNIKRKRIEVSNELAKSLKLAWKKVLMKTRYPAPKLESGMVVERVDGSIYIFYLEYEYFGQTHSSESGQPKALVELGEFLISCVNADSDSRPELLRKCAALATSLALSPE